MGALTRLMKIKAADLFIDGLREWHDSCGGMCGVDAPISMETAPFGAVRSSRDELYRGFWLWPATSWCSVFLRRACLYA